MATEGGAQALGIDNLGRIEPGWIVVFNSSNVTSLRQLMPQRSVISWCWRSGQHVRDVMVAGEWRVRNGEVLGVDVERAEALLRKRVDFGFVRSDSTGARYRISWRQGSDSDSGPHRSSVPRRIGAAMLIRDDGSRLGTVGGGEWNPSG